MAHPVSKRSHKTGLGSRIAVTDLINIASGIVPPLIIAVTKIENAISQLERRHQMITGSASKPIIGNLKSIGWHVTVHCGLGVENDHRIFLLGGEPVPAAAIVGLVRRSVGVPVTLVIPRCGSTASGPGKGGLGQGRSRHEGEHANADLDS